MSVKLNNNISYDILSGKKWQCLGSYMQVITLKRELLMPDVLYTLLSGKLTRLPAGYTESGWSVAQGMLKIDNK